VRFYSYYYGIQHLFTSHIHINIVEQGDV